MQVTFDINRAKVDTNYRTEALKLYEQGKLQINDNDLKWLKEVTGTYTDNLKYEIIDEDENKQDDSKKELPVKDNSSSKTHAIVDLGVTTAAMGASTAIGLNAASGLSGWQAQMAGCNSMATEIACITAFAVGTKYMLTKPNKDEHNELMDLQDAMETGNLDVANAAIGVENASENVDELNNEVATLEEDFNDELEAKEKELEEKENRLKELEEKARTEEGLSDDEQAEFDTLPMDIDTLKGEIKNLKDKTSKDVDGKNEDIESEEETIDDANAIFQNVDEIAEYASGYDEDTKTAATVEAVAQGANAAMGFGAAAALTFHSPMLFLTGYGQIMRGLALAGAGMSTYGTVEQVKIASDISEEIDVRSNLHNDIEESVEIADDTTENLESSLATTESISKDMENIDVDKSVDTSYIGTVNDNTVTSSEEDDKKDKDKIEKDNF